MRHATRIGGARAASVVVGVDGSVGAQEALAKTLERFVKPEDDLHIAYVPPVLGMLREEVYQGHWSVARSYPNGACPVVATQAWTCPKPAHS